MIPIVENRKFIKGIQNNVGEHLYNFIVKNNIKTVIETGICHGYSSWYILEALQETDGRLYSIEAKPQDRKTIVVPNHLYDRWEIIEGPAVRKLFSILPEHKNVDLFFHDSDHSFGGQFSEYVIAMDYAKYIGSHDINHSGAWLTWLKLFGWKEIIHTSNFAIAEKR